MFTRLKTAGLAALTFSLIACSGGQAPETETAQTTPIASNASTTTSKPNIIFVLVDDMGFGDVGFNNSEIATPTLDMMGREGVILDHNYAYPICSPTRAALLTGRSPLEFGIDGPLADDANLPLDVRIMPQYFKDLGYQTVMIGKWHLGIGDVSFMPFSRGFDYHYGFLGGWIDFFTHVYSGAAEYDGGVDWQRNGKTVIEEGHATDLLSADAERVIKARDKTKPFLMYLAYNAPHTPLQTLEEKTGLNEAIAMGDRYVYAEMMTQTDLGLGRVIDTLRAEGILDNTLIVFSSDNGGSLSGGASNGPLRGAKGGGLEGGMRVPGVAWWPGYVDGGRKLGQMTAMHDWLPTLLEAAGGNPSVVDKAYGQSMWSALSKGETVERRPTLIGVRDNTGVFEGKWKYTVNTGRGGGAGRTTGLYDLAADPYETTDLSVQEPEVLARLVKMYEERPTAPSLHDKGSPPDRYFVNRDGSKAYDLRLEATRAPWADTATGR